MLVLSVEGLCSGRVGSNGDNACQSNADGSRLGASIGAGGVRWRLDLSTALRCDGLVHPRKADPLPSTEPHFRRQPRAGHRTAVRFWSADPTDGERGGPSQATTLNIGPGGAFILTGETAPPGTRLLVEVDLPDGRTLTLPAEVRWIADGDDDDGVQGMGVKFGAVDEETQAALGEHFSHPTATLDHDEG